MLKIIKNKYNSPENQYISDFFLNLYLLGPIVLLKNKKKIIQSHGEKRKFMIWGTLFKKLKKL